MDRKHDGDGEEGKTNEASLQDSVKLKDTDEDLLAQFDEESGGSCGPNGPCTMSQDERTALVNSKGTQDVDQMLNSFKENTTVVGYDEEKIPEAPLNHMPILLAEDGTVGFSHHDEYTVKQLNSKETLEKDVAEILGTSSRPDLPPTYEQMFSGSISLQDYVAAGVVLPCSPNTTQQHLVSPRGMNVIPKPNQSSVDPQDGPIHSQLDTETFSAVTKMSDIQKMNQSSAIEISKGKDKMGIHTPKGRRGTVPNEKSQPIATKGKGEFKSKGASKKNDIKVTSERKKEIGRPSSASIANRKDRKSKPKDGQLNCHELELKDGEFAVLADVFCKVDDINLLDNIVEKLETAGDKQIADPTNMSEICDLTQILNLDHMTMQELPHTKLKNKQKVDDFSWDEGMTAELKDTHNLTYSAKGKSGGLHRAIVELTNTETQTSSTDIERMLEDIRRTREAEKAKEEETASSANVPKGKNNAKPDEATKVNVRKGKDKTKTGEPYKASTPKGKETKKSGDASKVKASKGKEIAKPSDDEDTQMEEISKNSPELATKIPTEKQVSWDDESVKNEEEPMKTDSTKTSKSKTAKVKEVPKCSMSARTKTPPPRGVAPIKEMGNVAKEVLLVANRISKIAVKGTSKSKLNKGKAGKARKESIAKSKMDDIGPDDAEKLKEENTGPPSDPRKGSVVGAMVNSLFSISAGDVSSSGSDLFNRNAIETCVDTGQEQKWEYKKPPRLKYDLEEPGPSNVNQVLDDGDTGRRPSKKPADNKASATKVGTARKQSMRGKSPVGPRGKSPVAIKGKDSTAKVMDAESTKQPAKAAPKKAGNIAAAKPTDGKNTKRAGSADRKSPGTPEKVGDAGKGPAANAKTSKAGNAAKGPVDNKKKDNVGKGAAGQSGSAADQKLNRDVQDTLQKKVINRIIAQESGLSMESMSSMYNVILPELI